MCARGGEDRPDQVAGCMVICASPLRSGIAVTPQRFSLSPTADSPVNLQQAATLLGTVKVCGPMFVQHMFDFQMPSVILFLPCTTTFSCPPRVLPLQSTRPDGGLAYDFDYKACKMVEPRSRAPYYCR
jgi:hypothetical protein